MRVLLYIRPSESKAWLQHHEETFEQVPRVGEYVAVAGGWYLVTLVVWQPTSAAVSYQAEVFGVAVDSQVAHQQAQRVAAGLE